MADPRTKGRMIRRGVSSSHKVASLSREAMVLFFMIIPHLNSHGKMNGSPYYVKGEVVPLVDWFDIPLIEKCLAEISDKTNLKWFMEGRLWYLHSINWQEHQELKGDRLGKDELPSYSGVSPELVPPEVEVEVEEEDKEEGEGKSGDKSPPPSSLFNLWNEVIDNPKATVMNKTRDSKCRLRLRERPLDAWREIFRTIATTPFLCGDNDRGWRADFDWIISNDTNALKVMEGKYEKAQKVHPQKGGYTQDDYRKSIFGRD